MNHSEMIRPGYGVAGLHLRQPSAELLSTFGKPDRKRFASKLRVYWIYSSLGFSAIISRNSGVVLSLFFKPAFLKAKPVATAEGASFGATLEEVLATVGSPDNQGGDFRLSEGTYVGKWVGYDSGLGFGFDEAGRVTSISVFTKARRKVLDHSIPMRAAREHSSRMVAAGA